MSLKFSHCLWFASRKNFFPSPKPLVPKGKTFSHLPNPLSQKQCNAVLVPLSRQTTGGSLLLPLLPGKGLVASFRGKMINPLVVKDSFLRGQFSHPFGGKKDPPASLALPTTSSKSSSGSTETRRLQHLPVRRAQHHWGFRHRVLIVQGTSVRFPKRPIPLPTVDAPKPW